MRYHSGKAWHEWVIGRAFQGVGPGPGADWPLGAPGHSLLAWCSVLAADLHCLDCRAMHAAQRTLERTQAQSQCSERRGAAWKSATPRSGKPCTPVHYPRGDLSASCVLKVKSAKMDCSQRQKRKGEAEREKMKKWKALAAEAAK